MYSSIIVLDTETTGLLPAEHEVCELGWCELRTPDGDTTGSAQGWTVGIPSECFVNPGRSIPPEASAIHHILDEDVVGALPFRDAVSQIFEPEPRRQIVALAAHNCRYDRSWLTDEATGGAPWICTYKCALRLWPDAPAHNNQTLRYWRKPAGLPRNVGDTHRAGPDTLVTAFLLRDMLTLAPITDLIAWSSEPAVLPRCNIGKWNNGGKGTAWTDVDAGYLDWLLSKDFDEDIKHSARVERARRRGAA